MGGGAGAGGEASKLLCTRKSRAPRACHHLVNVFISPDRGLGQTLSFHAFIKYPSTY